MHSTSSQRWKSSGVRRVYGLPGDSLNGFTDAIRRSERITWEHVRHEETAAFAAAADAALTGRLAVCAGSCGPGNLHLINGLFDAQRSRVPVLAIAAHIPRTEIGSEYFQETHPQELFRECSVYCELVSTPEMAPRILEMAIRAAVEENGVAVVVIPGEVFLAKLDDPVWDCGRCCRPLGGAARRRSLASAAAILNGANTITILGGAGWPGAHDELVQLAATLQAPVVHALRGKEYIEYDNPYDVGMTGLLGFASGYKAIKEADVLLMLGTDFPYQQFYPDNATVIQVDIRGRNLGRRTRRSGTGRHGERHPERTAAAAVPGARPRPSGSRLKHYRKTRKSLDALAVNDRDRAPIRPEYVARMPVGSPATTRCSPSTSASPVVWAARYLTMNGRRRLIGSFNHGTHGLCAARWRSAHRPSTAADRWSRCRRRRADDAVRRVDHAGAEPAAGQGHRVQQLVAELRRTGDEGRGHRQLRHRVGQPDFAAVAEAMGMFGAPRRAPARAQPALTDAFAYDGPAVVDVVTARQELSIPPAITAEQAKGSRCTRSGPFWPAAAMNCSTWSARMSHEGSSTDAAGPPPFTAEPLRLTRRTRGAAPRSQRTRRPCMSPNSAATGARSLSSAPADGVFWALTL